MSSFFTNTLCLPIWSDVTVVRRVADHNGDESLHEDVDAVQTASQAHHEDQHGLTQRDDRRHLTKYSISAFNVLWPLLTSHASSTMMPISVATPARMATAKQPPSTFRLSLKMMLRASSRASSAII